MDFPKKCDRQILPESRKPRKIFSFWLGFALLTNLLVVPLKPTFGQTLTLDRNNTDITVKIDNKQINREPTEPKLPDPLDPEPEPVPEPQPIDPELDSEPEPEVPEPIERDIDFEPQPDLDPQPETDPVPDFEPIDPNG